LGLDNRYVSSNSRSIYDISQNCKRRNDEFQKSEEERRAILNKKAEWAKKRGDKKKSNIEHRMIYSKKEHYKEETREKMIQSLIVFGQRYPSRYVVYNNHLINVCDAVLKREIELGYENMIRSEKLGLMKYYKYEYMYAIQEKAGYQRFEQTKQ
jgi:phenylalanyl-tRNA synthetase alpha subunit